MVIKKNRPAAPPEDSGEKASAKEVIYIRAEPELVVALDEEAAAISESAGGLYVSRTNAARVLLRRALAHRLKGSKK